MARSRGRGPKPMHGKGGYPFSERKKMAELLKNLTKAERRLLLDKTFGPIPQKKEESVTPPTKS